MVFVDLLPSTDKIIAQLVETYNKKFNISYESEEEETAQEQDLGDFLISIINIAIATQTFSLMLEHMQWLTMLFMSYLPKIYGDNNPRIMQLYQMMKQIYDQKINVLVCPRRWGKTNTTSLFIASCLFALPGEIWVITAANLTCGRTALSTIKKILHKIHDQFGYDFIYKNDSQKELIVLNWHGHKYLRENNISEMRESMIIKLHSHHPEFFAQINVYAATPEGVRGPQGSTYNDEFLYEDPEAQAAIVPLVRQGNYIMINTCTRNEYDESAQLENLLNKRTSDGRPIINNLVWARICPWCRERNLTECKHPMPQPPWINAESESIKLYMETIPTKGNTAGVEMENETVNREMEPFFKGELADYDNSVWVYPDDKMRRTPLEWILVCTDPAGGGNQSEKNSKFVTMFIGINARGDMIVSFNF